MAFLPCTPVHRLSFMLPFSLLVSAFVWQRSAHGCSAALPLLPLRTSENLHTHHLQVTTAAFAAGPCVINVYINYERKFAFVELRTGEPSLIWLPQKGSQDMYLEEVFVLVSAHQKCTASGVMYSIQCNSHAGHTMLMPMHDLDASNVGQQQS